MLKRDHFIGWYFKCCNPDSTIAFIPSFHCDSNKKTASLQIITDDAVFNLPFQSLQYQEHPLYVKMGKCIFSEKGILLDIHQPNLTITGYLRFYMLSPIKYDIMGPFRYIPFMQCRHSVYSMRHRISGQIFINGHSYTFHNDLGYIEGDSGHSFPSEYLWTQCSADNNSLMLSVADIPFCGFHFKGIIGVILLKDQEFRIATYLGATIKFMNSNSVTIKQNHYELTAQLLEKNPLPLQAPVNGIMNRTIHESASCKARYHFTYRGQTLIELENDRASFEFEL